MRSTDKTKPYNISWTGFKNGDYLLTARATDAHESITSSVVTNISISNVTGMIEKRTSPVSIFPNPATDFFRVQYQSSNLVIRVSVYELQDRPLIDIAEVITISAPINIESLKLGAYLVKIQNGTSTSVQKLFIN